MWKGREKITKLLISRERKGLSFAEKMADASFKDVRNRFRLKTQNKEIKEGLIRDVRNPFKSKRENYNESLRIGNFYSNNYIEY